MNTRRITGAVLMLALLAGASLVARAQAPVHGIYSCVDAKGRKHTSDRPIPECRDREQKLHNPSGTVRTIVGPALTSAEREAQEAKERRDAEEQQRQMEEKRRERALLLRYPNKAMHDKERTEALAQIGVVRQAAINRAKELMRQRKELDTELEFYAQDPSRVPPSLKRLVEENAHSLTVQERFIADQDAEITRVNSRFDDELTRLRQLWARRGLAVE